MSSKGKLTSWQALCLIIHPMVATGIFALGRATMEKAGRDAWLSVLLGGLVALASMSLILTVMLRHPGKNLWQLAEDLCGRTLAKGVAFFYVGFYWIGALVIARMFWEMVGSVVLRQTPLWVLLSLTGVVVAYGPSLGLNTVARFSELALWALLVLAIFLMPLRDDLHWVDLLPIGGGGMMPILQGVPPALFSFFGFEVIIVFNNAFVGLRPKRLVAACLGGVAYVTLLYTVSVVTLLLTSGPYWDKNLIWPILQLLKTVKLPIASRMERPFLFMWTGQIYSTVMVLVAVVASGARYLVSSPRLQGFPPPIIGLSLAASGFIQLPISRLMELADWVGLGSLVFMFIIPALLLAASVIRHKEGG